MMNKPLRLVSHALCPYVQRAAIVLAEKGASFERVDIDLRNKPTWFLAISPLGKTPVLQVDDQSIFESAVICEYLDETIEPRMHPQSPLERAHHRAWVEFGSSVLASIGSFYGAANDSALIERAQELNAKFKRIESVLSDGPFFAGDHFCLVDAAFGPVFRYFDVFDAIADFGILRGLPKVKAWRDNLASRPSVRRAVREDYPDLLTAFLIDRRSALSGLIQR